MAGQATPTAEELEELIQCARYGEQEDLDDMVTFVAKYGNDYLATAKDDRGNSCLHMACANGHIKTLELLLPHLPSSALIATNSSQSTPLHWAALNFHLPILRVLCPLLPPAAFEMKNSKGKTPVQEAEEATESWVVEEGGEKTDRGKERVRREVVVGYLLGCMGLGVKKPTTDLSKAEEGEEEGEEAKEVKDVREQIGEDKVQKVTEEVERIRLQDN
ncbi:hypothetical protein T439DRAFT_320751 [Meredithblackwellia eburnea MCA 4105]